ncbi:MAG: tetratricopeptide repeat protein [Planctomycetota bacterium]|jgi:tetratricopeptide (TPR) repeat protein
MRKSFVLLGLGVVGATAGVLGAWLALSGESPPTCDDILAGYRDDSDYGDLKILYPPTGAVFPPEIPPPTFRWEDSCGHSNLWLVTVRFQHLRERTSFLSETTQWTPSDEQWAVIKHRSQQSEAAVTILGVDRKRPGDVLSKGDVTIGTSVDPVGAPVFYREVNLPFEEAVKDPAAHIRWRFGEVSCRERPPVVLEKLPVCGNCHSFSADGATLGMDVDYANDKGSYVIRPLAKDMVLEKDDLITWSEYQREDEEPTFGLLSQVSPDGRYVVSTVKDRSVFVPKDDLAFSQLFFPIKGILAVYDRQAKAFRALPGADDGRFVQSNPTWSPDGKCIVFARAEAYRLKQLHDKMKVLLSREECEEFLSGGKTFRFDLYRIPFNEGKGGTPEPLRGASDNGMSNYFPKYSPDGKWIVFCKANSFMLLQPDSELYIIPAEGGEARRMRCNTKRMNSWHSWSPNGRWLVFCSKAHSSYTQLFLTHVDAQGRSTPAVLLDRFTAPDRAANIPEFVNAEARAIGTIRQEFLNDYNFFRAGRHAQLDGHEAAAERAYRMALTLNPEHVDAHVHLGVILLDQKKAEEAEVHFRKAVTLSPQYAEALGNLGNALARQGKFQEAVEPLRKGLEIKPEDPALHMSLGTVLVGLGNRKEGKAHLEKAVLLDPKYVESRRAIEQGDAARREGKPEEALRHYRRAVEAHPDFVPALRALASMLAKSNDRRLRNGRQAVTLAERAAEATRFREPETLAILAAAHAEVGEYSSAVFFAERALEFAEKDQDAELAGAIRLDLDLYRREKPSRE